MGEGWVGPHLWISVHLRDVAHIAAHPRVAIV